MARAAYITEFERDCIRIAHNQGIGPTQTAKFLKRSRMSVHRQIVEMREAGTLENLPLCFMVDEIAEAIRRG